MSTPDDDYLFDGSGRPSTDVERLERLLRPLGHRREASTRDHVRSPRVTPPARRRRATVRRVVVAVAALAATAACLLVSLHGADAPATPGPGRVAPQTAATSAPADGTWIETHDSAREIRLGGVSLVRVAPRTRLQVRRITHDAQRLYLQRGGIEATVSWSARPRFFQVETDAARCVDLGCRYTLDVDDAGVATVRVLTGRVSFETPAREVLVPAGAAAVARPEQGPGTPCFDDAPAALRDAFAAFDALRAGPAAERRARALAALADVRGPRDTLPAWHLLQEDDAAIVAAADACLRRVAGPCGVPATAPPAVRRDAWKQRLLSRCW